MKFLKRIYDLNLINEADEAPPPPGMEAEEPGAAEAPEEVTTPLSPEAEVMYIRLLKKAMVMKLDPEDLDAVVGLADINESNAKAVFADILRVIKSYSTEIDIDV
tara:strand:- start:1283 stop:1597 length:315 start_codon:yes stop_codon:yes gene_type:complete